MGQGTITLENGNRVVPSSFEGYGYLFSPDGEFLRGGKLADLLAK